MPNLPDVPPEEIPDCHARGEDPSGYDPRERECQNCPDKFTCLPEARAAKLIDVPIDADLEVEAVLADRLTFDAAMERFKLRLARIEQGAEIREEESTTWVGLRAVGARPETGAPPRPKLRAVPDLPSAEEAGETPQEAPQAPEAEPPAEPPAEPVEAPEPPPAAEEKPAKKKPAKKAAPKPAAKAPKAKPKPAPKPKAKAKGPAPEPAEVVGVTLRLTGPARGPWKGKVGRAGVGEIRRTAQGWGWYGLDGAESAEWFEDARDAVAEFAGYVGKLRGVPVHVEGGPAPEKAKKPAPKADAANGRVPDGWPRIPARDKPFPRPRILPEEAMREKLAEVAEGIGAHIPLDFDYQLVRRLHGPDGPRDVIVRLVPNGFAWTVTADRKAAAAAAGYKVGDEMVFSSLSSAVIWAEARLRAGNEYFSIENNYNTEIRDPTNRIVDRLGGVPALIA